jgi:ABC-type transporter Mla subunit MlaD
VLEFPLACGITVGTPVRIRGVPIGSVLSLNASLEKVEVLTEVSSSSVRMVLLGSTAQIAEEVTSTIL